MTPEERQLITGLFDRMRSFSLPEKDGEAEALINERVRTLPDAPYMLVQSVLIQEQALQEASSRIKALEEQVRALQGGAAERAPGSGGFLGGLFGGSRAVSEHSGSVPPIGARATPSAYDSRQPWTPLQGGPQQAVPQAAAGPGGSFLRTAMATAAGVAGGMLVAGAIRDLMGSSAHATPAATTPAATSPTPDAAAAASETARPEPAQAQEQQPQDVADDDGGWFGGDAGDFEI